MIKGHRCCLIPMSSGCLDLECRIYMSSITEYLVAVNACQLMRWLILYGVRPSLYPDSVQWESCSSSIPGIALLGHCWLPLGTLNRARCAPCMEQVQSGCLWVWDNPDSPSSQHWDQANQAASLSEKAEQHRCNLTTGWQIKNIWGACPHKDNRIFEKTVGLQVGRGLENWQGFFSYRWALGLEKKLPDCGVVWEGREAEARAYFCFKKRHARWRCWQVLCSEFITKWTQLFTFPSLFVGVDKWWPNGNCFT